MWWKKNKKTLKIPLKPLANFTDSGAGEIVAFDVGYDGRVYIVTATKPLDYRTSDNGMASFAKTQGEKTQSYRVYQEEEGEFRLLFTIDQEPFNLHHFQPLTNGLFLSLCARCHFRSGDPEANARIFDSNGDCVSAFTIGDGIQDIGVASDGRIWASYFDEGIFGNYGWDNPLGSSGLVAWDSNGNSSFQFNPENGLGMICDCYAMNVSEDDVWIYYYTDFPLVQISNSKVVKHWSMPISGADCFAIESSIALFRGGYDNKDQYHLVSLSNSEPKITQTIELKDEKGQKIEAKRAVGRGESIYLLRDTEVYQLPIQLVMNEKLAK